MNVWNAIGVLYSIGRHVKGCVPGCGLQLVYSIGCAWVYAWVWIAISADGNMWTT
jgi:hypothetical protein